MCSDCLNAKKTEIVHENKERLTVEEIQDLTEFEAHVRRGIEQFEAGLGKTFKDKDEFLNYLRNL